LESKIASKKVKDQAENIYNDLQKKGIGVLYDNREETPGIKFVESDLIGIPIRLIVSEKTLDKQSVEIKKRTEKEGRLVKIKSYVQQIIR